MATKKTANKNSKTLKQAVESFKAEKKGKQLPKVTTEFKVDTSKGQRDGTVSSQWASRPEDQRYTSLGAMEQHLRNRAKDMVENVVTASSLEVGVRNDSPVIAVGGKTLDFTNYGFGYLSYLADAPAPYLRSLPADLAAKCLETGLKKNAAGETKIYHDSKQAWAFTSPTYGRIMDHDVVAAVRKIAGNGTGDTNWKIPGCIDWNKGTYNPFVDPTKDTTTLYASDHDVFMFLVDDTHPIEVGKLQNGDPDLVFRGFYVWNSEVGARSFGISTFYLRGVCCNRNLWGVEDQTTLAIRHTKNAPDRFVDEAGPALVEFANASALPIVEKVKAAKTTVLAKDDKDRETFLMAVGLTRAQAKAAIQASLDEELVMPATAWDMTNAITALARRTAHTDTRLGLEKKAANVMARVK